MKIRDLRNICFISLSLLATTAYADLASNLKKAADAVNQNVPTMLDSDTRLDKATTGNKQLNYYYTLVNYSAAELDAGKFKDAMMSSLVQTSCSQLKPFFSQGVAVEYHYNDKNGKKFTSIALTSKDCST